MTATVSPSTTGKMLNEALGPLGLMFNGGHCVSRSMNARARRSLTPPEQPDVGVGGFLLQGGQGWCARTWGWSAEQIESMQVVTAAGELVTASRRENADLFWAARGSGPGFFGVVVSFTLKLKKVVGMYGSTYIYDTVAHYDEVAKWYLETCPGVPSDCELVMLGFRSERVMPHLDPPRPVLVVRALCFTEDETEAKEALTIFAKGVPSLDKAHVAAFCQRSTFTEEYQRQADDNPIGRYFVQNAWLDGPLDKVAQSMKAAFVDLATPQSFALHFSMAPLRALPDDMCFSIQTPHTLSLYTIAPPDTDAFDAVCQAYQDKVWTHIDALRPEQGGSAGIYLGDSDLVKRPVRFMSEQNWARFCELRTQWDPKRTFAGYDGEALHGSRWNRNPWELVD